MRAQLVTLFGLVALSAGSCSFTTATGFEECKTDTDCGAGGVCVKHYCLPLPEGCKREAGSFDKGDRIALGALLPVTTADGGVVEREAFRLNAMRLALEEANKLGGLGNNREFGLIVCNANKDDAQVQAYTNWLISNLQAPAILVSGSSRLRAAANEPARVDAGTFLISANATNPGLAAIHRSTGNVWRVAPADSLQAVVLAGVVKANLTAGATVSILYEGTDYGNGLAQPLADSLASSGFNARSIPFDGPLNEAGATAKINELANTTPAATVVIAFPADVIQLMTIAKTRSALQIANGHRWFMSDSAKDPSILTDVTRAELAKLQGTAPAQGQGSAYRTFRDGFASRFGVSADSYSFTAHSYDAMWLTLGSAASASKAGAITGPGMADGIPNMSKPGTGVPLVSSKWTEISVALAAGNGINADGSSGDLQFDAQSGSPLSPYEVWGVTDAGVISTLRYVNP